MDVGSGNGYFAWRMREAGARFVVCLEPSFLSFIQFHFLNHFADDVKIRFPANDFRRLAGKAMFI